MHGDSSIVVVEHCDEFEACTEPFEVLAKRRDPDVIGMLQLGDRTLCDVESTGGFCKRPACCVPGAGFEPALHVSGRGV